MKFITLIFVCWYVGPGVNLPANWTHVKLGGGQLCHEQQLHPGNPEYDRVKSEFQKTGGSGTIVKVIILFSCLVHDSGM